MCALGRILPALGVCRDFEAEMNELREREEHVLAKLKEEDAARQREIDDALNAANERWWE